MEHIPHRAPWLLVDRVIERGADRVRALKRLTADDPLGPEGLGECLLIEALAQAAACVEGAERGAHRGYLVAASQFEFHGRAQVGETLELSAVRTATLGALHRFAGEASVDGKLLAKGEMTFAVSKANE
jgi:3-hydroxyacyl-[acyl-carrier-protein] dehydratase